MATAFTPVGDPTAIEGWLIGDGRSRPFEALVVFDAEVAGKRVEGCPTAYSGRDATVFEKPLPLFQELYLLTSPPAAAECLTSAKFKV
jgi:hypothetical protein